MQNNLDTITTEVRRATSLEKGEVESLIITFDGVGVELYIRLPDKKVGVLIKQLTGYLQKEE